MTVTTMFIIALYMAVIFLLALLFGLKEDIKRIDRSIMSERDSRRSLEYDLYRKINRFMDYLNLEEVNQESPIIRKRKK